MIYSDAYPIEDGYAITLEVELESGPISRTAAVRTPETPSAREQLQMRVKLLEWALGRLTAPTSDDHDTSTMWV